MTVPQLQNSRSLALNFTLHNRMLPYVCCFDAARYRGWPNVSLASTFSSYSTILECQLIDYRATIASSQDRQSDHWYTLQTTRTSSNVPAIQTSFDWMTSQITVLISLCVWIYKLINHNIIRSQFSVFLKSFLCIRYLSYFLVHFCLTWNSSKFS